MLIPPAYRTIALNPPSEPMVTSMQLSTNEFLILNFGYDKPLSVDPAAGTRRDGANIFPPDRKNPVSPIPYNILSPRHEVAEIRCEVIGTL
jgi:hypothetical protein